MGIALKSDTYMALLLFPQVMSEPKSQCTNRVRYDYSELRPYSTAYLPDFLADRFDVTMEQKRAAARARWRRPSAIPCRTTAPGGVSLRRGKVRYARMPVWMLNTKWQGKVFLFAMNGQTGRLVRCLPMSRAKFWGLFAAIAVPLSALTLLLVKLLLA